MDGMLISVARLVVAAALACSAVGCQDGHAEELSSRVRVLYTGSLTTTVEQSEAEVECGSEYMTFESSGYLSIDRAKPEAHLEGFGCNIGLAKPTGTEFSANEQECVPAGVVNFKGLGLDRLVMESFSVNLGDKQGAWRARAWRELPSGRVSYCFSLTGLVEQR
jgi:hypothetical protein